MIQLIKTPTSTEFYNLVSNCNNEMILCAPFIKKSTVDEIIRKKKEESKLTVITSSNISNFIQKSSDLSAIKNLLENNATVLNYQNLHAKIYMFDKSKALITSANLTHSGMNYNYEYGVLIDENEEVMNQIEDDFIEMLYSDLSGEYKLDAINQIEKDISKIISIQHSIEEIDGENTLVINDIDSFLHNLSSWKKDVFIVINEINSVDFTLSEVKQYKELLQNKHPNNHNIEDKIRQTLQYLRNMGLIKFVSPGHYKKLFKIAI